MVKPTKELPPERLWQPVTAGCFVLVFGASLAYSVVRYHFFGDVEWQHFPLFIINKAVSLAAVLFLSCSYLAGKVRLWNRDSVRRLVVIKFCGLAGFFSAGIHALLSLNLLTPAYFEKHFDADGRLNLQGEFAVTFGVVALFALMSPAITSLPMMSEALGRRRWKRGQRLGYAALLLVLAHLAFLGGKGWLMPSEWHGGLPPISLVAALAVLAPLLVRYRSVRNLRDQKASPPLI